MSDDKTRTAELGRLYDLMEALSDEHDADDARLEKVTDGRAAIVMEFDVPAKEGRGDG